MAWFSASIFTANKFSVLENDKMGDHNDINVVHIDGTCQSNTVVSNTRKTSVKKVSVDSNLTKDSAVSDIVVNPVLGNR